MRRKGYQPTTQVYILGLTILVVLFAAGGGMLFSEVQENFQESMSRADGQRILNAIAMLASEGSATMKLSLNNEYGTISIQDGTLTLEGDFIDQPYELPVPNQFLYTSTSVSGREICVEKRSFAVSFSTPPCNTDTVSCSTPVSVNGDVPGPKQVVTAGDRCVYYTEGGSPRWGYACTNEVFNEDTFYKEYYNSCVERSGEFVEVNRVVCPDRVGQDAPWGCMVAFTYRCNSGQVTASLSPSSGSSTSFECTEAVEHRRHHAQVSLGTGTHTVTGTVNGPGGSSSGQATVEVQ